MFYRKIVELGYDHQTHQTYLNILDLEYLVFYCLYFFSLTCQCFFFLRMQTTGYILLSLSTSRIRGFSDFPTLKNVSCYHRAQFQLIYRCCSISSVVLLNNLQLKKVCVNNHHYAEGGTGVQIISGFMKSSKEAYLLLLKTKI